MKKAEETLNLMLGEQNVAEIKKTFEPLYMMDITISEVEEVNPMEKRYGEYVYQCACVELTPLSFGEFCKEISEGKCENCLINPGCKCE